MKEISIIYLQNYNYFLKKQKVCIHYCCGAHFLLVERMDKSLKFNV
jgi:hypothetical protein